MKFILNEKIIWIVDLSFMGHCSWAQCESMGQYDWAHLNFFIGSNWKRSKPKQTMLACYACLFNCFTVNACYAWILYRALLAYGFSFILRYLIGV